MNKLDELVIKLDTSPRLRKKLKVFFMVLVSIMILSFVGRIIGSHYYLHRIFETNVGEKEAHHELVYQGIGLVRASHLSKVNLSPRIWDSQEFSQRFMEGMYPIRLDRNSKFILIEPKDQVGLNCQMISQQPLVLLVKCP